MISTQTDENDWNAGASTVKTGLASRQKNSSDMSSEVCETGHFFSTKKKSEK